jgi:adenylate kinase
MKYRTVLLVGAPGSGKGTQGKILGTIPGHYHCSCGDVFRRLRPESDLGRTFLQFSSRGQLVPDEFTVRLWRENIAAETQIHRFHPDTDLLILDGIPRNPTQVHMLQDTLNVVALLLLTSDNTSQLIDRMQRRALKENRLDDANLDTIQRRFRVYQDETRAVLHCYPTSLIHTVDASQTPTRVLRDILAILDSLPRNPEPPA